MPYTGFDPLGHGGPPDVSGGGLDPSAYYALSPGGRFPGDVAAFLEYLHAASRGDTQANPDYEVPGPLDQIPGRLGRLFRFHEWNVRNNGLGGPSVSPLAGHPFFMFSGPGARFGPPGGPLHGLVDQGNGGIMYDWPTIPSPKPEGQPPKRPGGRGGGRPASKLPEYQGLNHKAQFLDWQPVAPGEPLPETPARFVPGAGQAITPPSPEPTKPSGRGGKPPRGGQKPGAGGKPGQGGTLPTKPLGVPPPGTPSPGSDEFLAFLRELFGENGPTGSGPAGLGGHWSRGNYRGVNFNNLDRGPMWTRDPTSGVYDTSGMPLPTPWAPREGQSWDDYAAQLHDQGFDQDSIMNLIGGGHGWTYDPAEGSWRWGWGTGPVMRTPDGYQFARQTTGGNRPASFEDRWNADFWSLFGLGGGSPHRMVQQAY